jgi:hypothetical protein
LGEIGGRVVSVSPVGIGDGDGDEFGVGVGVGIVVGKSGVYDREQRWR